MNTAVDSEEQELVKSIMESIYPHLAGQRPEIQGFVIADLLAAFVAGHYRMGDAKMREVLRFQVAAVERLVPINVEIIKQRTGN